MIRNQEIERTFILGPLFLNGWWYLSLCFSGFQQAFIQNTSSSSAVFVCWCPLLTIYKCSSLQVLEKVPAYTLSSVSNLNNLTER